MSIPKDNSIYGNILNITFIAIVTVVIASLFRKFLLSQLENQVVWITFYPAAMVAAVFGGIYSGILSSILTIITVVYFWSFFTSTPFLPPSHVSTINIIVFFFNCFLISVIAEYSRLQRRKSEKNRIKAEEASNTKSIFLANMSHEIRTPLNAILGFSQVLLRNPSLTEEEKKQVKLIYNSGNHLLTIINDILDISKIEFGQLEISNVKFNFFKLLNDMDNMFSSRAKENNILFSVNYNEATPKYIVSDEKRLRQILVNFLGNAFKFTDKGSIVLDVYTKKQKGCLYNINITIRDSGTGIKKEELDKIFDNFYQGSNSRAGTGLGLSITKKLVGSLGSSIKVESNLGLGSNFSFDINVKGLQPEKNEVDKEFIYVYKNDLPNPYKVLIVDDILDNITLLETLLKNINFEVHTALSAEEGIKKFCQTNFDIIFMDILLPDLNGNEVIKKIRDKKEIKQPIIIGVSASIFKEEIKDVLKAGADDFLPKPINIDSLYSLLEKWLNLNLTKVDINLCETPNDSVPTLKISKEQKEQFFKAIDEGEFLLIGTLIDEISDENKAYKTILREALDYFDYIKIKKIIGCAEEK